MIDKHTLEIKQDEEKTVYKNLEEIGDDLPDHSPRFVLLSYPLTLVSTHFDMGSGVRLTDLKPQPSGRISVPYILLYYLPVTCNAESRMLYAGAKELIAQLQAAHPDDDLYDAKVTVLGEQIDHHVEEEEGSMFPQAKGSGIDTVSLGAALLKRKAELLANPNAPSVMPTGANGVDAGDEDDRTKKEVGSPQISSARPKRPRHPATTKHASHKKASHKAR